MDISIPEKFFYQRKRMGLKLIDGLVLGWCIGLSSETISKKLRISRERADSSINRLCSAGLVKRKEDGTVLQSTASLAHADHYNVIGVDRATSDADKPFMLTVDADTDESLDTEEYDILKEAAKDTLSDPRPSRILSYWKILFEHSLGRVCTEKPSKASYGKLNTIKDYVRTDADIMILMEYVIYRRINNEPLWEGADIRDPTLGLLVGPSRISMFMQEISKDDKWMKRRALYNYIQCGNNLAKMRRIFPKVEFEQLEKYIS